MSENSKAPTSTSPLGNTAMRPSVLERGIDRLLVRLIKVFGEPRADIAPELKTVPRGRVGRGAL